MIAQYLIVGEVVFLLLSFAARRGHRVDAPMGLLCAAAALSVLMWPLTAVIFVFAFLRAMART